MGYKLMSGPDVLLHLKGSIIHGEMTLLSSTPRLLRMLEFKKTHKNNLEKQNIMSL